MEERDDIPRREALAGISFLAVLILALVGTVVVRIVRSAPDAVQGPTAPGTWASHASPHPTVDSPLQDARDQPAELAASHDAIALDWLNVTTPIPTAEVATATRPIASETPALAPLDDASPEAPPARPVFVAPGGYEAN